eukprot:TRINITY_DN124526_c0_g1_i1.p1 TRINITY_DN124526_c0_g1~~TRINITY_DN124526_c0_g1_i1.p1  ORF type:complete len:230 (-),score=24.79 TRINITY_DN124526_c0_g1_i1:93-722(-)
MSAGYCSMVTRELQRAIRECDPAEAAAAAIRYKLLFTWLLSLNRLRHRRKGRTNPEPTTPSLPMPARAMIYRFLGGPSAVVSIPSAAAIKALTESSVAIMRKTLHHLLHAFLDKYIFRHLFQAAQDCLCSVSITVSDDMRTVLDKLYNDFPIKARDGKGPDMLMKDILVLKGYRVSVIGSCSNKEHSHGVCWYRNGNSGCSFTKVDISW